MDTSVFQSFLLQDALMITYDANLPSSWYEMNAKPLTLYANYANRGNMTWNHSTTTMSKSVNNIIGADVYIDATMLKAMSFGGLGTGGS